MLRVKECPEIGVNYGSVDGKRLTNQSGSLWLTSVHHRSETGCGRFSKAQYLDATLWAGAEAVGFPSGSLQLEPEKDEMMAPRAPQ